ncbi:MAG: hypothetical protein A2Y25_07335 [Candidatus Melainabacteria bacterium GWF2_37_15]|nr:MAG: hypothetical protein A2Y25_07335 [Candidatus Melainabacteria bacterium GWF2_37_15]
MSDHSPETTTIANYLIQQLKNAGIEHIFGIPGDYVINFFSEIDKNGIKTIGTCTEQGAAFAADAYARLNGIGALCVTYCVGGLNTINAVAGAYAEKAPLVVISGAPGTCEHNNDYLLHHSIRDQDSQLNMFKEVTVSQTRLSDPHNAPFEINRVIKDCLHYKRPVYIELPRDMVHAKCVVPIVKQETKCISSPAVIEEALVESVEMIKAAKNPIIMGCVEIRRYGLEQEFTDLLEKSGYPYVTTILGKSIIDESHPQFAGVYMGKMGDPDIKELIEKSDCIIMLGVLMTDTNLGNAQLDVSKTIYATADQLCIKHHYYKEINLKEYMSKLSGLLADLKKNSTMAKAELEQYTPDNNAPITVTRFFQRLNSFVRENSMVICDVGDCLFGSVDLKMPKNSSYLGPAYYTSMGYAVPATLGAMIAKPDNRPIVIVGDGAFQMTGMELSSIAKNKLNPIVFIVNNKGYTTQRYLKDGPYNDINNWNYHLVPDLIGSGVGLEVKTEQELEEALITAENNTDSFSIINVHFDKFDKSPTLYRLTSQVKQKVLNQG